MDQPCPATNCTARHNTARSKRSNYRGRDYRRISNRLSISQLSRIGKESSSCRLRHRRKKGVDHYGVSSGRRPMGAGSKNTKGESGMTCFMCKGDMEEKLTTFMVDLGQCIIIVKNVPSHVCRQCGEVSYSDEVSARLETIVETMKQSPVEIAVSNYAA